MRRVFVPFVFFMTLNMALAEYEIKGGWTPISNEEVYQRLNFYFPTVKNIQRIDKPWNQNLRTIENYPENKNDAIQLVEPQKIYKTFEVEKIELTTEKSSMDFNKKRIDGMNGTEIEIFSAKSIRKAKKIDERNDVNRNIIIHSNTSDFEADYNDQEINKDAGEKEDNETYEEILSSETTDVEPLKYNRKPGYVYSLPNMNSKQAYNNFTNNFLNILNKYNINNKDKLINYAKSRVPNIRNISKQEIVYLPFPIRFLERFNSKNHLSVDPLMAVFLSNYGYYLPHTYGIHNNYRNLYGYLASNNIHNNKPFGNYKVFSDTDSSS